MLNKERREVINAMSDKLSGLNVDFEKVGFKGRLFTSEFEEWVHSEYVEPFKLTQAEKCILELLRKKGYAEIKRDRQEDLWVSDNAVLSTIHVFNAFFRFVKKGERLKIKDILENCEVIDDVD